MNAIRWLASAASLLAPIALVGQQADSAKQADTALAPVSITGYVTSSFTWGTQPLGDTIIAGRAYDRHHNSMLINVANLTLERLPATEKVAAGFHAEAWLGPNAAVVKSNGLDLGPDEDIWQAYAILNLPLAKKETYLQLKGGKMATLLGVEVGEDILNPNWAIGYQDIFLEPFTETGVELDGKFSPKWDAELRLTNGWDQVVDVNLSKSVMVRVGYMPDDKTLIALVGYAGPEQPNNNSNLRSGANLVASRKFGAAGVQLQLDHGGEEGAATNGGYAKWYAAGTWLTYDVAKSATIALRGDYMNDRDGARTSGVLGFPTNNGLKVGSVTGTLNVKYWDHALLRPEVRFDSAALPVFDGHKQQMSFGGALSYIF